MSVVIVCVLAAITVWALGQRDAFDPNRRDLPPAALSAARPQVEIYNAPLKPWSDFGASPASAAPPTLGLLPDGILDEDWRLAGRVRTFGPENLYEKINGEAERFLKQGFKSLHYAVLRAAEGGAEIAIELYDQGDVGGSMGVFSEHLSAGRSVTQKDGVTFFMTSAGLIGRKGRFFFRVAADRSGEAVERKSAQLAKALAMLAAEGTDRPAALQILTEAMGIEEQQVSFRSRNVFQFDFAKDFWFARLAQDPAAQAFLHSADSPAAASDLADKLLAGQQMDYKTVGSTAQWTTLQHSFLATYFALGQRGRFVFGVENLKQAGGVEPIMARLSAYLADD